VSWIEIIDGAKLNLIESYRHSIKFLSIIRGVLLETHHKQSKINNRKNQSYIEYDQEHPLYKFAQTWILV